MMIRERVVKARGRSKKWDDRGEKKICGRNVEEEREGRETR